MYSELESSILGRSSTIDFQGLRSIDCRRLLTSVRKVTWCVDCSSPLEMRERMDLGFLCGVVTKHHYSFLEGPMGSNNSCITIRSACVVEAFMVWPFTQWLIGAVVYSYMKSFQD